MMYRRTIVGRNWTSECFFSGWLAHNFISLIFFSKWLSWCCVRSHGEALTFEPLLMQEESQLSMFSVLAIASVTQVIFVALTPKIEPITSLPLKVTKQFYIHAGTYI